MENFIFLKTYFNHLNRELPDTCLIQLHYNSSNHKLIDHIYQNSHLFFNHTIIKTLN